MKEAAPKPADILGVIGGDSPAGAPATFDSLVGATGVAVTSTVFAVAKFAVAAPIAARFIIGGTGVGRGVEGAAGLSRFIPSIIV